MGGSFPSCHDINQHFVDSGPPVAAIPDVDACSVSTADTSTDPSKPDILGWLESEMNKVLDSGTSAALVACVDVILADDITPAEETMSQAREVLVGEGVPEELVSGFMGRWTAKVAP